MWRKNKMENKNLNTAVKDEKVVKTEEVKEVRVNEATGEIVEENNKIYQPIKCTISHRKVVVCLIAFIALFLKL